jgi:hypothetical protein
MDLRAFRLALGLSIIAISMIGCSQKTGTAVEKPLAAAQEARTKRQAIVTALEDFNHRRRMADLIKHAGTCAGFMSADEVKTLRRKG